MCLCVRACEGERNSAYTSPYGVNVSERKQCGKDAISREHKSNYLPELLSSLPFLSWPDNLFLNVICSAFPFDGSKDVFFNQGK